MAKTPLLLRSVPEIKETLSPLMLDALKALRSHGLSSYHYLVENFPLSTWKALARRNLIELYMDADRTYIRNLVLTNAGRQITDYE